MEADLWSVGAIDQSLLPHRLATIRLTTLDDAARAIATMQVRGAPLIGATAAYGVCLALRADASDEALEPAFATLMTAHSTSAITLAPHRVGAMVLRYLYLLRSSWTRLVELIYWPAVQLFVWGFLQLYIAQNSGFFARATGVFIAAVLMWDVLFRGQLGFSVSFLEEMWSRNLSNLMISPLRPIEFVCALMIMLAFVETLDRWYMQMLTVPKPTLAALIRLGTRIVGLLPFTKQK